MHSVSDAARQAAAEPQTESTRLALRTSEAARALGVSEYTLRLWTRMGLVPHIKCAGAYLYPIEALTRWLNGQAKAEEGGAT